MTGVIKKFQQTNPAAIKTISMDILSYQGSPVPINSEVLALQVEAERLESEYLALEAQLEKTRENNKADVKKAYEQGKSDAQHSYIDDEAARLNELENSLQAALSLLQGRLEETENLALLLAKQALTTVFEPATDYRDQVTRMITHQLKQLRENMILKIYVSRVDFPEDASLQSVTDRIQSRPGALQTDEQLAAGSCRIDLTLGHIELSLQDHWSDIRLMFDQLEQSAAGSE